MFIYMRVVLCQIGIYLQRFLPVVILQRIQRLGKWHDTWLLSVINWSVSQSTGLFMWQFKSWIETNVR